jgi:hypothetical protein
MKLFLLTIFVFSIQAQLQSEFDFKIIGNLNITGDLNFNKFQSLSEEVLKLENSLNSQNAEIQSLNSKLNLLNNKTWEKLSVFREISDKSVDNFLLPFGTNLYLFRIQNNISIPTVNELFYYSTTQHDWRVPNIPMIGAQTSETFGLAFGVFENTMLMISNGKSVLKYNYNESLITTFQITSPYEARNGSSFCFDQGNIILHGGSRNGSLINELIFVDFKGNENHQYTKVQTSSQSPIQSPFLIDHSVVSINENIYFYGGFLSYMYVFNRDNSTWNIINPKNPIPGRSQHCGFQYDQKMYIYGGKDITGKYLNDYFVYDVELNTFTNLTDSTKSPSPRIKPVCQVLGDFAYIFGGYNETNQLFDFYKIKM